jgi:hypothetical protein
MKARGAISIMAALEHLRDLLGLEHVLQRVEQRAQVRVDLRHEVAGQEAEALAGLDGGAGEDDAVDLAARQRGRGGRDGQPRLARARRPDAEGDRVAPDRVDVALLLDRLRRDLRRAVAPDDVLEDLRRRLLRVERAGHGADRPGRDLVPALDELDDLADDLGRLVDGLGLAVEREHVAAQEHLHLDVLLERAQDRVPGPAELGGDRVGQLDLSPHPPSTALTSRETRPPSARPSTAGSTVFMTLPMSRGDCAPASATARSTIVRSSASDSSAGR